MYRENGGDGAEIVPTKSQVPWLLRDLVLAAVLAGGGWSLTWLTERWEQSALNVSACTAPKR